MVAVDALAVASFLGREGDQQVEDLAATHLPIVLAFANAYTRGKGFTDDGSGDVQPDSDELAAVIVSACARQVTNPTAERQESIGDYSHRPHPPGWTLPELTVLHRYRRRTA